MLQLHFVKTNNEKTLNMMVDLNCKMRWNIWYCNAFFKIKLQWSMPYNKDLNSIAELQTFNIDFI